MEIRKRRYQAKDFKGLETAVNKVLDLAGTNGSGSVAGDGDGKGRLKCVPTYSQILAECKFKESEVKTLSIKKSDFKKTEKAALRFGRIPAMFTSDIGGDIFAILLLEDLERIYKNHLLWEKNNNDVSDNS
jgi:hypothetical protein